MPKPHIECYVKQKLASLNKTQEWLATQLPTDPGTLSKIIRGYRNPRVTLANQIARLLGTTTVALWPSSAPKRHK